MAKTSKTTVPTIADTFKALSYCMSTDTTRGSLCSIHADCEALINHRKFTLVATDGHILLRREMVEEDWNGVRRYMKEEHNAELPMTPETMSFFTDKKTRIALNAPMVEMSSGMQQYLPYPRYQNVIPTSFERPPTLPTISTVNYTKIEKIQRIIQKSDSPIRFEPDGWNSPVGAVIKRYDHGFELLVMSLRPSEEFTAKIGVPANFSFHIL